MVSGHLCSLIAILSTALRLNCQEVNGHMISLNTRPTQKRLKCKPTSLPLFNTFAHLFSAYFAPKLSSFQLQAPFYLSLFSSPSSSVCPTHRTSHVQPRRVFMWRKLAIIGNNRCPPNGTIIQSSPPQPCQAVDPLHNCSFSPALFVLRPIISSLVYIRLPSFLQAF